jgi:hypothetical protein
MNRLQNYFLLGAAALVLGSCALEPTNVGEGEQIYGGGTTPAKPVFTYTGLNSHGYPVVMVMDSTGANQTAVYTWQASGALSTSGATWSPNGDYVCFQENPTGSMEARFKTVKVTVDSKGKVVGSNVTTIMSTAVSDSMNYSEPTWSSTSSTNKIAFTRWNRKTKTLELCTMPASGGSATVLYTHPKGTVSVLRSPTWSADDSKLAFVQGDSSYNFKIKVYDFASQSITDTLLSSALEINHLEWSRTGTNVIAYRHGESNGSGGINPYIYYWVPVTGNTPTTDGIRGQCPTWSPNNARLHYEQWNATGTTNRLMSVTPMNSSIDSTFIVGFMTRVKRKR